MSEIGYDQLYWNKDFTWAVSSMSGELLIEHSCTKTTKTRTYANYKYNPPSTIVAHRNYLRCDQCHDDCPLEVFEKWVFLGSLDA